MLTYRTKSIFIDERSLFPGRSAWVVIEDIRILTYIIGSFGQTCVSVGYTYDELLYETLRDR
ncbi:hypothetical protein [Nostoc sp. 'Lobaria pulmonaria (5183) cyanobiont']|uniref:hypothetical protein n=1 Tax=Nostoc sp. 'Lobaria pulmonaria (5183) cyanobiont' TaxID=1618022 RepID=UPI001319C8BA|nr:hypothetical protein [Nostoc sp. 'Lobaria pulmonaria (5183) cyanobiont']